MPPAGREIGDAWQEGKGHDLAGGWIDGADLAQPLERRTGHDPKYTTTLARQGRAHHCGVFPQLEDQMTMFTPDIDRKAQQFSPDRVDALVWALTELLVQPMESWGAFEAMRRQAEQARRTPRYEFGDEELVPIEDEN
jgi:hypothetical protein